jgi:hypothetical protein
MNMTQAIASAQLAQLQVLTARLRTPRPHTLAWLCASQTRRNMYHIVTYSTWSLTWQCDCRARGMCTHIGAAAAYSAQASRAAADAAFQRADQVAIMARPSGEVRRYR